MSASLQPKTDKLRKILNPSRARVLRIAGYSVEALSVALSLMWSYHAQSNQALGIIFSIAFIGFVAIKALAISNAVDSFRSRNWGVFTLSGALSVASLTVLLISSIFNLSNDSNDDINAKLNASLPAVNLQKQIDITQEKLNSLSAFADGQKAVDETARRDAQRAKMEAQSSEVIAQLAALEYPPVPAPHNKYMNQDCSPKTNANGVPFTSRAAKGCEVYKALTASIDAKKKQLQAQLHSIRSQHIDAGSYADQHAKYQGLQSHLDSLLEKQSLMAEGGTVTSVYSAEDKMIASLLGIENSQAASFKWAFFCIIFDCIGFLVHLLASLIKPATTEEEAARKKLNVLLSNGFNVNESLAALGGGNNSLLGHAAVSRPHLPPELMTGGRIHGDGLATLHAQEAVLNPQAVAYLDKHHEGLIDELNALQNSDTDRANDLPLPRSQDLLKNNDTRSRHANGRANEIQGESVERVPAEKSQKPARGRLGKVDTCANPDCGADYLVTAYNKLYCNRRCSESAPK